MEKHELIDLIWQGLRKVNDPRIKKLSTDNDSNSAEIIITIDDEGKTVNWVLSSFSIKDLKE